MLEIPTVCSFLRTEDDLPSLKKLEFSNIGIDNFQAIQDCGNDSFTAPNQKTNKIEVKLAVHRIRILILKHEKQIHKQTCFMIDRQKNFGIRYQIR